MRNELEPAPSSRAEAEHWLSRVNQYLSLAVEKLSACERLADLSENSLREFESGELVPIDRQSLILADLPATPDALLPDELQIVTTVEQYSRYTEIELELRQLRSALVEKWSRNETGSLVQPWRRMNELLRERIKLLNKFARPLLDFRNELQKKLTDDAWLASEDSGHIEEAADDAVASLLTGNSFLLFQRLRRTKNFVSFETLRTDVWDSGRILDKSIKRALERLRDKCLCDTNFTIQLDRERVKLVNLKSDK